MLSTCCLQIVYSLSTDCVRHVVYRLSTGCLQIVYMLSARCPRVVGGLSACCLRLRVVCGLSACCLRVVCGSSVGCLRVRCLRVVCGLSACCLRVGLTSSEILILWISLNLETPYCYVMSDTYNRRLHIYCYVSGQRIRIYSDLFIYYLEVFNKLSIHNPHLIYILSTSLQLLPTYYLKHIYTLCTTYLQTIYIKYTTCL